MVRAALRGRLESYAFHADPTFGLSVPEACPEVPTEVLDPRSTWDDPEAYDVKAKNLAALFRDNFERHADQVSDRVRQAGPVL
jgi:phosphoenolpyruvate carboxykinase (ATP)